VHDRRTIGTAACVAAALVLAACGGGSDVDTRDEWDEEASTVATDLAADLEAADLGCTDFTLADVESERANAERGEVDMPLAQGNCTTRDEEDLQISVLESRDGADAWFRARTDWICREAAKSTAPVTLPGLPYILGARWVIQPDSQGMAYAVAPAIGGTAGYLRCKEPDPGTGPWDEDQVEAAIVLAERAADAGFPCAGFLIDDPDFQRAEIAARKVDQPGAIGRCSDPATDVESLEIATFASRPETDAYLESRQRSECASRAELVVAARGDTWVIVATDRGILDDLAAALGGEVAAIECG
jgi:hypothetical protein